METINERKQRLDSKNVFGSIVLFGAQCKSGYESGKSVPVRESYLSVKNIVVLGMGGSALPGHILKSQNAITLPFEIWSRYGLPAYVSTDTLVIAMSYSGTTEETLSALSLAETSGAKIAVITTGGTLEAIAREKSFSLCVLSEETNPCRQPRFGLASATYALLGYLENLGFYRGPIALEKMLIAVSEKTVAEVSDSDPLLSFATMLAEKNPVIVAAEHLGQAGHFLQNQFNETSKTFALYHELPELNHHLLEGLMYPKTNKDRLAFIFLMSEKYSERIQKRISVTKEVIEAQGIPVFFLPFSGEDTLIESTLALVASEYISYYLGLLHDVDPSQIPWVIHLKEKLA